MPHRRAKLNETAQTAPKKRIENKFWRNLLIIGSEIWHMLDIPIKNCFDHRFSGFFGAEKYELSINASVDRELVIS